MVTRIAILILLAPSLVAGADDTLGAPSFDTISETTYRQLTWDDFRGKGQAPPGWGRWSRGSYAHINAGLRLGRVEVSVSQEGEAWRATAPGIRPFAIMDKSFSAVLPGSRNDYTLAHEQLHFDIAETMARRLSVELAGLTGRGSTVEEARADLEQQVQARFAAGAQALNDLQAQYDGETENGGNKRKQKKWAAAVSEMFREATEALAAQRQVNAAPEAPSDPN